MVAQSQLQKHPDPIEASQPKRARPGQTCLFPNESSFKAQVILGNISNILHELDLEIYRTLRRLRKVRSIVVSNSNSSNFVSNSDNSVSKTNDSDFYQYNSFNFNSDFNFGVSLKSQKPMENNDRTLKEYSQLELAQSYELKSGLIDLPPQALKRIFLRGLFHDEGVGILEDYVKMKAFPFSLDGAAKD
ncbi:hypothetical protein CR513_16200, partial [Mucuna pruriens]